jgi:hypothetical protein
MKDRNVNFGRYRNFGNFGSGGEVTDAKRCCIPIPKPIPKLESIFLRGKREKDTNLRSLKANRVIFKNGFEITLL